MKNNNQVSRKHHFVPRFYLSAWHNEDGKGLWLYRRNGQSRIEAHRRNAASVGFEKDLYALLHDGLSSKGIISDDLETMFFSRIDDAASIVHRKLLKEGVASLSIEERAIWALFLNSIIERTPHKIQSLVNEIGLNSEDILSKLKHRRESTHGSPPEKSRYLESIDIAAVTRNTVLKGITQFIVDDAFVEYVCEMNWQTFELPPGPDHFLTSDAPLILNAGVHDRPIYMLSIALSPMRLLIISTVDDAFDQDYFNKVVTTHSIQMGRQAEKYLV